MASETFLPDTTSKITKDFAAKLFVHHLGLAISYWEIGGDQSISIDRAAAQLTHDSYRRTLYAMLPVMDHIYAEMEK